MDTPLGGGVGGKRGGGADLDPNDKRHRRLKEAQQLVREHGHEQAVPGEGAQQGYKGQHTRTQQADIGTEHDQLLLQQRTCTSRAVKA